MDLLDAMRTNGAVRAFTDERVDDDAIARILDSARFAPSGGNAQGWRVAVVRDPEIRRAVRDQVVPVWRQYVAQNQAGERPFVVTRETSVDLAAAADDPDLPVPDFVGRLDEVPVMLVIAVDLGAVAMMDKDLTSRPAIVGGASIYPFVQNVLLAARTEGLGGVLTTFLARREPEIAGVLGLPDGWALCAVVALGVPEHQATKLTRRPVESFTTIDRFDGSPFPG